MADIGKIRGHAAEATERARADQLQRKDAEKRPGSIILGKQDVQGEYDIGRLLYTTLGGQNRVITTDDLATFRQNIRQVQKRLKKGVTARQVIDLAKSHPLPSGGDGMTDLERARKQIHTGVAASANVAANKTLDVRFITNAGPDSDVHRHHVLVKFLAFDESARAMMATATDGARAPAALTPKQAANRIRHGRLAFDCDCGRHRYFLRYIATIGGFNAGRDEHGFPKIRNPGLRGIACKHVLRVMSEIDSSTAVLNFLTKVMEKVLQSADNKARLQHKQDEAEKAAAKQAAGKRGILTSADRDARNTAARERRALESAAKKAKKPKKPTSATGRATLRSAGALAKQFGLTAEQVIALLEAAKKG
ncbi:hypothetical protein [Uliginosibacterium sediminicola]|uniref:SWIM-type domain-containing protein n=1 Tax=Uliginosibacterium sediminicola TaxID=2024550 RepID=A0ABU9YVY7_9RHOO